MTRRRREFPRLTCEQVLDALERHHGAGINGSIEWAFAREIPTSTGGAQNRIDALAVNCWRSKAYIVRAYEVKISRADFLRELRQPHKSATARDIAHEFVFATPKGMVDVHELPIGAGLIEVDHRGRTVTKRRPDRSPRGVWTPTFLASVIRSAQRTAIVDKARIHDAERARVYAEILAHHAARSDSTAPAPDARVWEWRSWAEDLLGDRSYTVWQAVNLLGLAESGVDRTPAQPRLW